MLGLLVGASGIGTGVSLSIVSGALGLVSSSAQEQFDGLVLVCPAHAPDLGRSPFAAFTPL
jgi:hypothetical protein